MLETVREFAYDKLVESGDLDEVRRRHAEYMVVLAEEGRPLARGPQETELIARLTLELDNFRAAFAYALETEDAALGLTLAEALEPLWIRGMRQREAVRWLDPLLRLGGDVDTAVRAGALTLAGRSAIEAGEVERAEPWFRAGLELARESGDELRTAWALHGLGHLRAEQGNSREAQALFEESMELFLKLGDHAPAGGRMTYLAHYAAREGDLERARSLYERAAEQYRLAGDAAGVGGCLHSLGDVALERSDVRTALEHYLEAQPLLIPTGTSFDLANVAGGIAAVAGLSGRPDLASRLWGALERLDAEADRKMAPEERANYGRGVGEPDQDELLAGQRLSDEQVVALVRSSARELAGQRSSSR
jgi:tetratricopeptide (TPR) repeat protein